MISLHMMKYRYSNRSSLEIQEDNKLSDYVICRA